MTAQEQTAKLASFILSDEVDGLPNPDEGAGDTAIRLMRELQVKAKAAGFLFGLLDDIDSASDQAKGNDVAYRRWVMALQKRRFEVATTDGYEVTFTCPS